MRCLQVKPVVDITWFSWQLWRLTGRRGMTFLYLYSFMGFACLKLVTPDFALLAQVQQALEGAFRYTQGSCFGIIAAAGAFSGTDMLLYCSKLVFTVVRLLLKAEL